MSWINNEMYESIIEHLHVYKNKFICTYKPVYGLVKINDMVLKISDHEGFINTNKEEVIVEYIKEKFYLDGVHGDKLNEKEIYKILISE